MIKILIVEDDPLLWQPLQTALEGEGYSVRVAMDGADALAASAEESFDLLLEDLHLPDASGLDIMREITLRHPACKVLVMTGHATIENAVEAMKIGAFDFITKPFHLELVFLKIRRLIEFRDMAQLVESAGKKRTLVTRCPDVRHVIDVATAAAPTGVSTLVLGESGTGKEVLADHIQSLSTVRDKAYIKVNCAAIPDSLFESELFGSEKGAYTGSIQERVGYVEAAHGGTLFLDEITEIPLPVQGKLLRVLEDGSFYRVGGARQRRSDFRLIATSSRDLPEAVRQGGFREDLYYRINVIAMTIPPLRLRREDIPLLTAHFLKLFSSSEGAVPITLSPQVLDILSLYSYPGNVRELRNILEHLSLLYPGEKIKPAHLPSPLMDSAYIGNLFETFTVEKPLREATQEFEARYIEKVLKAAVGSKTKAAALLGISRKVLWEKLNRFACSDD